MRMTERLIREAVRRSTGDSTGSITYRNAAQASGAGTPSSRAALNTPSGGRYFMLGVDSFDDATRTF